MNPYNNNIMIKFVLGRFIPLILRSSSLFLLFFLFNPLYEHEYSELF